jgi:hypothetical protein
MDASDTPHNKNPNALLGFTVTYPNQGWIRKDMWQSQPNKVIPPTADIAPAAVSAQIEKIDNFLKSGSLLAYYF